MARESVVFSVGVLGVIVGLAALLFGEAAHGYDQLVSACGIFALLAVFLMAAYIARL
jgi:hypothetical protein